MDKRKIIHSLFKNRVAILATMHKKEEVISPILENELGIEIVVPEGFNTDQFGTFTGDIERMGDQYDAARHKAMGAMYLYDKTLAFASEGSFGPHPVFPFVPFNREIVVLIDKENDIEISGITTTTETNYGHKVVRNFQEAYEFSIEKGFPEHRVVIKVNQFTSDKNHMIKGITNKADLENAVEFALKNSYDGEIYIETDMRALYNPTRMRSIEAATNNLIKNIFNLCPKCGWPGFKLINKKEGLPCSWCGLPTKLALSYHYHCKKCGYTEEKLYPNGAKQADPGNCQYCNP